MYYDKYSRGSKAYMALAGEIIRREEKLMGQGADTAPAAAPLTQ
jgi:chromosome partitioning protein